MKTKNVESAIPLDSPADRETNYLLRSPKNASRLGKAIKALEKCNFKKRRLLNLD